MAEARERGPVPIDELEARIAAFVRETVIPFEGDPRVGPHGPDESLRIELQELARQAGLLATQVGVEWGGQGLSHAETAVAFRGAGYSILGPVALNCMAPDEGNMHLLERVATSVQKERYLRPLAAGETRSAFLMTEPEPGAGSDPSMLATEARPDGAGWRISGRKRLITGAAGAGFGIVMARTEGGASMFLIDMAAPGVRIVRVLDTIDRSMPGGHAVVELDDFAAGPADVLGEPDQGFRYAQVRLAPARLTHCMRWWGAAKRAHDIALAYACKRHAFGKLLIDHEGVGYMLADNAIELRQAELTIDDVARVLDAGGRGGLESSMAKVACSEALFRVADRCVQVLGGAGVTDETPVHQIFRELRAFRIYDGPSEVHRWSIAKSLKRQTLGG